MPILKSVATPHGVSVTYHQASHADANLQTGEAIVQVASWATEPDHNAGRSPAWTWPVRVPVAGLADIDAELIANEVGPFIGGTVVTDESQSLDALKLRKWAQIKEARTAAVAAPLATPHGTFDADKESRDNIADAVAGLEKAIARGAPDAITWTLADNTTATLTLAQLTDVALLLLGQVNAAHDTGRALRTAIDLAAFPEDLEVISWPT